MIKIFAILVLFFVACYSTALHEFHSELFGNVERNLDKRQQPPVTCPQNTTNVVTTCTGKGSTCPAQANYLGTSCTTNGNTQTCTQCQSDLTCTGGSCQSRINNTCPAGTTCQVGFGIPTGFNATICNPTSNVCIYANAPGDGCQTNGDCGINGTCSNNVCTGLAIGGNCTYTSQCVGGAYCKTGTCTAQIQSGATCLGNSNECVPGTYCTISTKKVCTPYLGAVGSNCELTVGVYACASGAYCNTTYFCTAINTTAGACNTTANCGSGQECACSGNNAVCQNYQPTFPSNCTTQLSTLATCVSKNQVNSYSFDPNSLIQQKCGQSFSCLLLCIYNNSGAPASCLNSYSQLNTACNGAATSENTDGGDADASNGTACTLTNFLSLVL